MMSALPLIRELHAIRLKIQDETARMTDEEACKFSHDKATAFLASCGITPEYAPLQQSQSTGAAKEERNL
jgi:hypothetical protein